MGSRNNSVAMETTGLTLSGSSLNPKPVVVIAEGTESVEFGLSVPLTSCSSCSPVEGN